MKRHIEQATVLCLMIAAAAAICDIAAQGPVGQQQPPPAHAALRPGDPGTVAAAGGADCAVPGFPRRIYSVSLLFCGTQARHGVAWHPKYLPVVSLKLLWRNPFERQMLRHKSLNNR